MGACTHLPAKSCSPKGCLARKPSLRGARADWWVVGGWGNGGIVAFPFHPAHQSSPHPPHPTPHKASWRTHLLRAEASPAARASWKAEVCVGVPLSPWFAWWSLTLPQGMESVAKRATGTPPEDHRSVPLQTSIYAGRPRPTPFCAVAPHPHPAEERGPSGQAPKDNLSPVPPCPVSCLLSPVSPPAPWYLADTHLIFRGPHLPRPVWEQCLRRLRERKRSVAP